MQENEGLLHPVRFVSKVFKDAEMNYTSSEKEVFALLKALDQCFHCLVGAQITVYARHSTLKWLFTCKSLGIGRTIQWAAMLSPWNLTIVRPVTKFDAVLEEISPRKAGGEGVVKRYASLEASFDGFVVTFDGAARVRTKDGVYAAIVWKVPEWSVRAARYGYGEGLTTNDSEYQGLLLGLNMAFEARLENVVVCGDSRVVVGQVSGELRCHSPSLQIWMAEAQRLAVSMGIARFIHVASWYNQPADFLTRKG
ncbi:TPA: hypothetical protein N0F65_004128 [Lagenidium giganteum]|uniref:RNase H type-1 domain-containing protein n=1 Tax=Lagenidium giganteum TaxID=4803 RepID=A0AAV2ZBM1_9STRA|nr:TPA: hypothetical protein N0F65_004128 [Lagenidium giganteum]